MTPEGSSSERRADNPVGDITLQDAISLVVRQRPELAAFGWERSARDAQLRQAGAYPNPVVEGAFGPAHVNVADQRRDRDSLLWFVTLLVQRYRDNWPDA